jgi:hypothetical protein
LPPIEEETMRFPILSRFDRAGPDASPGLVSRRRFFGASAGAAGAVLGSGLWTPAHGDHSRDDDDDEEDGKAGAKCPDPNPIPHTTLLGPPGVPIPCPIAPHFFFPGNVEGLAAPTDPTGPQPGGRDPSVIFDFDGVIGEADVSLTGTGTDTTTGHSAPYSFDADMRFMAGRLVATDGAAHKGAFVFI